MIVVSINNTKNLFDEIINLLQNKLLVTKNLFDENNNLLQNKLLVTEPKSPNKFSQVFYAATFCVKGMIIGQYHLK